MNWLKKIFKKPGIRLEIDEELRFHIEQRTSESIAAGMAPEEAAREARKRFGNFQAVREQCREKRGATFGDLWPNALVLTLMGCASIFLASRLFVKQNS